MSRPQEDPYRRPGDPRGPGIPGSGVFISGNASVGAAAAGDQAHAVSYGAVGGSAAASLDELLRQLEEGLHAMGGPRADDAIDDIGRVRQELASRRPDRPRLSQLMEKIMTIIPPVSALLEVANSAKDLITAIPH